jgi:hypothetical protein
VASAACEAAQGIPGHDARRPVFEALCPRCCSATLPNRAKPTRRTMGILLPSYLSRAYHNHKTGFGQRLRNAIAPSPARLSTAVSDLSQNGHSACRHQRRA